MTTATTVTKAENRRAGKLSASQVGAAYALIKAGEKTVAECATMYSVSRRTMQRALAEFGIKAGSGKGAVSAVVEAHVNATLEDPLVKLRRQQEARNTAIKHGEFYQKLLLKLTMDPLQAGEKGPGSNMNHIKTVLMVTQAAKNLQELLFDAHGITNDPRDQTEEQITVLIQEMDGDQIKQARERKDDDLGDGLLGSPEIPNLDEGVVEEGEGEAGLKGPAPGGTA